MFRQVKCSFDSVFRAGESELDPALPGLILNTARFRVFYKLKAFLQTALVSTSVETGKNNNSHP